MQVSADRTERDLIPAQHNLVAGYLKKTLSSGWSVSDSAHTHTHRRFYHIHAPRLQQFLGKVGLGKKVFLFHTRCAIYYSFKFE